MESVARWLTFLEMAFSLGACIVRRVASSDPCNRTSQLRSSNVCMRILLLLLASIQAGPKKKIDEEQ